MSDQPCPTCGGTTGFVKRRGTLDVCDDPWHDEQQPKRMGENGCDCDVVWRSTYVNVCQQRDELLAALKAFTAAANSWHNFHHGSTTIQCDLLCKCIVAGEAAIAKAEGRANEFTKGGGLSCEGEPAAAATEETGRDRPAAPICSRCGGTGWINPPWPVGPGGAALGDSPCSCKASGSEG